MKSHYKILISIFLFVIILLSDTRQINPQSSGTGYKMDNNKDSTHKTSTVETGNGYTEIRLTKKEMQNSGISTVKLLKASTRMQLTAYGSVVSIKDLSNDAQNFENAKAQLLKSEENLLISQKNFARIKSLYKKKLASEQDYQTAKASYFSDSADVISNQSNLTGVKSKIIEQWGNNISKSIFYDSTLLQNLLSLNETLVQISLPPGENNIKTPGKIFVVSPQSNGKEIICNFISESHIANSQFQTRTLFYAAQGNLLSSGMNVKALLPAGEKITGVIIPGSSVVWYNGIAWIYVESGKGEFIRTAVNTDIHTANGFFIPGNKNELKTGAEVVSKGAELLLSKELMPVQKTSAGEEDND